MPSPQPIKSYLEAVAMHREGNEEQAAQLLAESLGTAKPSPIIKDFIGQLLTENTMPNDAVLQVLSTEVAKGAKHG